MTEPNFTSMTIELIGGLALFLYGMARMTEGLRLVAGDGLRAVLGRLTRNRFLGVLTGAGVTAVIQSSSVTTVLVVGLISAGLLSLSQSVGVIMGANIGTTITAQMIAFKITAIALPLVTIGFAMEAFLKPRRAKRLGSVLLGFGLIFLGMEIMSSATSPLRTHQQFIDLMQHMSNPVWAILIAAAFTAAVQSSSATTGIVIVLAGQGLISLEAGIALIMGANVGTCITSMFASIGKPREALQAACVHVLFNIAGVLLWIGFIAQLADLVRLISPVSPELAGTARLAAETPRQIANAHTVFNVANSVIFIWFAEPMAQLIRRIVPDRVVQITERARPQYLDKMFLATPGMALDRVRLEVVHLGRLVLPMVRTAVPTALTGSRQELESIARLDDDVDSLYNAIHEFLGSLSQSELSPEQTRTLAHLTECLNAFEAIGDTVETSIAPLGIRRIEQHIPLTEGTIEAFQPMVARVTRCVEDAITALEAGDGGLARSVSDRKTEVNTLADQLMQRITRPPGGERSPARRIAAMRIEIDLLEVLRRTFYFAKRVSKAVAEMTGSSGTPAVLPPTTGDDAKTSANATVSVRH